MNDAKKHILVVEDSQDLQELLARLLGRHGYRLSRAFNGKEALEALGGMSQLPSFILLDLMMPIMDGFEFRERQRQDPRLADIPVVIMTADAEPEAKSALMGAHAYFRKPLLDIESFLKVAKALTSAEE